MARPALSLCLLAVFATAASLCNRSLRGRRQQALSPPPERRLLSCEEAARIAQGRVAAEPLIAADWRLAPEEAARVAMAWPAFTPLVSTRLQ